MERMTGVPAATIREWQDRYGQGWGTTGIGGETLYSRDDIEAILAFSRQQGHEPAGTAEAPSAGPKPGARLLVLLAERDEYAAELTEYFLRTEGYEVETVFDAEEALRRYEQVEPDLAIVELLIDGGAGFELCRRLRAKGTCPVVAISAAGSRRPGGQGGRCSARQAACAAGAHLNRPRSPRYQRDSR